MDSQGFKAIIEQMVGEVRDLIVSGTTVSYDSPLRVDKSLKSLKMTATDVALSVECIPRNVCSVSVYYFVVRDPKYYLKLSVYRLPCPYKSTLILLKGTRNEILAALAEQSMTDRITEATLRLADNLADI